MKATKPFIKRASKWFFWFILGKIAWNIFSTYCWEYYLFRGKYSNWNDQVAKCQKDPEANDVFGITCKEAELNLNMWPTVHALNATINSVPFCVFFKCKDVWFWLEIKMLNPIYLAFIVVVAVFLFWKLATYFAGMVEKGNSEKYRRYIKDQKRSRKIERDTIHLTVPPLPPPVPQIEPSEPKEQLPESFPYVYDPVSRRWVDKCE